MLANPSQGPSDHDGRGSQSDGGTTAPASGPSSKKSTQPPQRIAVKRLTAGAHPRVKTESGSRH
jgi:hypothetical protein